MERLFGRSKRRIVLASNEFPVGLHAYVEPSSGADVDLIFVHGLTGGRETTWTAHGASRPWFETLLPHHCPSARIMAYGYDADVTDYRSVVAENRIENHAKNMLSAIGQQRNLDGTNERPIIFIAHSLGGLVCMDTLLASKNSADAHLKAILRSTKGIAFVGTPHSGSGLAVWGERIAKLLGTLKQVNDKIIAVLRSQSEVLARIQNDFHTMLRDRIQGNEGNIRITCFFEELPLPVIGTVVPKESAILSQYIAIGIHANHLEMTKFSSDEDPGFKSIFQEIKRWLKDLTCLENERDKSKQVDTLFSNPVNVDWSTLRKNLDPLDNKNTANYSTNYKERLDGTAEWLFEVDLYQRWETEPSAARALWICGPPGCGKSVLAGSIITRLQEPLDHTRKANVLYSYCTHDANAGLQAFDVLRTFVYDLALADAVFAQNLCITLQRHGVWGNHSLRDVMSFELFWTVCTHVIVESPTALASMTWVIDGVDEIEQRDRDLLVNVVEDLLKSMPGFRVLLLSRNEYDVRRRLSFLRPIEIKVTENTNGRDLQHYISDRVERWGALGSASLKQKVRDSLNSKAGGIFLWVKLVVDELEHLHDLNEVETTLARLPGSMKDLYNTVFRRISDRLNAAELSIFRGIMIWATLARKSLYLSQLASALSPLGTFSGDSLRHSIPRLCGSLVTIEEHETNQEYNRVRLLHASLADYLVAQDAQCEHALSLGQAHAAMVKSCLQQLRAVSQSPLFYPIKESVQYKLSTYHSGKLVASTDSFGEPSVIDPDSFTDESSTSNIIFPYVEKQYPMFSYARNNCAYHMEQSTAEFKAGESVARDFEDFVFNAGPAMLIWLTMNQRKWKRDVTKGLVKQLLAFCQKMRGSACMAIHVVKDVALQILRHDASGWLLRLRKMRGYDDLDDSTNQALGMNMDVEFIADARESALSPCSTSINITAGDENLSSLQPYLDICGVRLPQHQSLQTLLCSTEDDRQALFACIAHSVQIDQNRWLLTFFGHALCQLGHIEWLSQFLYCLDGQPPLNTKLLEMKAQLLFSAARYTDAADLYSEISGFEPTRWDLKEIIIAALCLNGQRDKASRILENYHTGFLVDSQHDCPHAWVEERRAQLSSEDGNLQQELAICTDGIAKYPDWFNFWERKQNILARFLDCDALVRCLQAAQQRPRLALRASKQLNGHLLKKKRYQLALEEASYAIERFPKCYEANELLWRCWLRSPAPFKDKVLNKLRDLTKCANPYWISLVYYAKACIQLGQHEEAVEVCLASININGSNVLPIYFAAKAYDALDRPEAALDLLCSASLIKHWKLDPTYSYIARLARRLERWEELENVLLYLKKSKGEAFPNDEALAYAYLRRGKFSECQNLCQERLASLTMIDEAGRRSEKQDSNKDDEAEKKEQSVLRLKSMIGLALGCQGQTQAALEQIYRCTSGEPSLWYLCGGDFRQEDQLALASFCIDAGLQDNLDPQQATEKADVSVLRHKHWTCDRCKTKDFKCIGYMSVETKNLDICAPCLEEAQKDGTGIGRWLKCPSSAYPRLKIWYENGEKKRGLISNAIDDLPPAEIIEMT